MFYVHYVEFYIYLFRMVLLKIKSYDKQDDFDFDIVNFPFLDGDVPRNKVLTANKDIDIINFVRLFQNLIGGVST